MWFLGVQLLPVLRPEDFRILRGTVVASIISTQEPHCATAVSIRQMSIIEHLTQSYCAKSVRHGRGLLLSE
ncbi:hypothetical protein CV103_06960 [Sphingomonas fennica]|uniref:Uncharacterized protein n=1 Tax=Edaphosphingomonas fennica TaxID=114404 RepID=A0A2T4I4W2_9SPHN|nr:hypothetical protein CV103_06960 [Sphingomonas fennica]